MQYEDIEIFLSLSKTHNISLTAKQLHLAQSTVSNRLKKMEEQLGFQLITRQRGVRSISFTPQGEEFVETAEQWRALFHKTYEYASIAQDRLRIATNESSYYELLYPLLFRYHDKYPDVRICLTICPSVTSYKMMENRTIDYAFSSFDAIRENIMSTLIYEQEFGIAVADPEGRYHRDNLLKELDPHLEIRFTGGQYNALNMWRYYKAFEGKNYLLELDSTKAAIPFFRRIPGSWAFFTSQYAKEFKKEVPGFRFFTFDDPPDKREVFFLRSRDSVKKPDYVSAFESELFTYLKDIT